MVYPIVDRQEGFDRPGAMSAARDGRDSRPAAPNAAFSVFVRKRPFRQSELDEGEYDVVDLFARLSSRTESRADSSSSNGGINRRFPSALPLSLSSNESTAHPSAVLCHDGKLQIARIFLRPLSKPC